ncbi:MAG TPA: GDSL-type esterase/lipase family protein [Acidimicrobiales bacterium]|nr:GDSL-type esterase/lipase family protein [Acidimicrobiales bacterium]
MSVLGRIARVVHPGLRTVYAQVARYAADWEAANGVALGGAGPLWVVLGDSTAQGIGAPSWNEGYVGQLLPPLNEGSERQWRVVNLSRSGARAADVVDRQLPALEALPVPPDLVTCAIGANDIVGRTPEGRLADQLRRIIARLPKGAIIATLPQGLSRERTEAANRVIRDEAPAAGLVVADVWARTGPPWRGKLAQDGFHPGALGYADWAAAFASVLDLALHSPSPEPGQPPHRTGSGEA